MAIILRGIDCISIFIWIIWLLLLRACCQAQINKSPEFLFDGDMARFAIREDTAVGSIVYTLKAMDPEGGRIIYGIKSDYFTVQNATGVVTLTKALDREAQDSIEVVISATDEKLFGTSPNKIEIKRQIAVIDANDNAPKFMNVPYSFSVDELTNIGEVVFDGILVFDKDSGINAEVTLMCSIDMSPDACEKFEITTKELSPGEYQGVITLKANVDYEEISMYLLTIKAEDLALTGRKSSSVNVVVKINDAQDQAPVFLNSPYFAALAEGTPPEIAVLTVHVQDGDKGNPRPLNITLSDDKGYFSIMSVKSDAAGIYTVVVGTSDKLLDREDPFLMKSDGQYTFHLKATEMDKEKMIDISAEASVTILITDINDHQPVMSAEKFNIAVAEDIPNNSSLSGLHLLVEDIDLGENGIYKLHLESEDNSTKIFSVEPKISSGATSVTVRVIDSSHLDFEDPAKRSYNFKIVANDQLGRKSVADVHITVNDANDNVPVFAQEIYKIEASENLTPGTVLTMILADDADSGLNGEISYFLQGFDSEWFKVNSSSGEITVADCGTSVCLDREKASQYILTYGAKDGLGKAAVVPLIIKILDVNDNPPTFIQRELIRNVPSGAEQLIPPLFVKAVDKDSAKNGNNNVTYKFLKNDAPEDAFAINASTGEITIQKPLGKFNSTKYATSFTLHIEAEDGGMPSLTGDAYVIVTVTSSEEQELIFVHPLYNATILETDHEGTSVLQVAAVETSTKNATIVYNIVTGAQDNFVIDSSSGMLSIAANTSLDLEVESREYIITVEAISSGILSMQSATTTVYVLVEDVNNKAPVFLQDYYVAHLSKSSAIGGAILQVSATDVDDDHLLQFSLGETVSARDRAGVLMSTEMTAHLKDAFVMNATSGEMSMRFKLDHSSVSVIYLNAKVRDINANIHFGEQVSTAEIVVYIGEVQELNPTFPPPWTPTTPQIIYSIPEEPPVNSKLFTLTAKNPAGNGPMKFEKLTDENGFVEIDENTGVVALKKRLDFEELPPTSKHITFVVKAMSSSNETQSIKSSTATVIIDVQDINDNAPIFSKESYHVSVAESASYPHVIIVVQASDKDQQSGFGDIRYSLSGDGNDVFTIDSLTGMISVAKGKLLDRETKMMYNLKVIAADNPEGTTNQRRTSALVTVEVLDVNDNPPVFSQPLYQAIIPETVVAGFNIKQIQASDADVGKSSHITYSLSESSQLREFLIINGTTGNIQVSKALAGKGRTEPYKVVIQATDNGEPSLSADVHLLLFITDVSTNDGIPKFIKPTYGDVVSIPENSPPGTVVTVVKAFDPDDPQTDSGRLRFSFIGDRSANSDEDYFAIDSVTGTITSRNALDYETQENYTVVIVVKDMGSPPQHRALALTIRVTDVDDHLPHFIRPKNSVPLRMETEEEVPPNTVIGYIEAVDEDKGENAAIHYVITDGNFGNVFAINRTADNLGKIFVTGQVDRETRHSYLLTIKAIRPLAREIREGKHFDSSSSKRNEQEFHSRNKVATLTYDPSDFSMMQVVVTVKDIDDHHPVFKTENSTTGIKTDTEPGVHVFTFEATDEDETTTSITYKMKKIDFYFFNQDQSYPVDGGFFLEANTGVLRTMQKMSIYEHGYFVITVEAISNNKTASTRLTVFILQERELLRFVFNKPLAEVRKSIDDFRNHLQETLQSPQPIKVNLYDAHLAAQEGVRNASSLCFNFLAGDNIMTSSEAEAMLDLPSRPRLALLYRDFGVRTIENCSIEGKLYTMNWIEICILVIAAVLAITAVSTAIVICHLHRRYKRNMQQTVYQIVRGAPTVITPLSDTNGNGYSTVNCQRINEWQERSTPL